MKLRNLETIQVYDVRVQVLLSMYQSTLDEAKAIVDKIAQGNSNNKMMVATKNALDENQIVKGLARRLGGIV